MNAYLSAHVLDYNGVGRCTNVVKLQSARAVAVMPLTSHNERFQPKILLTRDFARDGILVTAASGNRKMTPGAYPARSGELLTIAQSTSTVLYDRFYKKNNSGHALIY